MKIAKFYRKLSSNYNYLKETVVKAEFLDRSLEIKNSNAGGPLYIFHYCNFGGGICRGLIQRESWEKAWERTMTNSWLTEQMTGKIIEA